MSKTKELVTDRYIDLWSDMIDADYRYEQWLMQQQDEEKYQILKIGQNENITT
jgi:hypothetical protein